MLKSIITAAIAAAFITTAAHAQNAFSYQGTLQDGGLPANGNYDMRFTLWDDFTPGAPDTQIGSTFINSITPVTDGLFTVNLDLDDASFQTQSPRFIQVDVRFNGDPTFTTLTPRQQIVYTPRAIHALTSTQTENIQLPYGGSGTPSTSNSSVFSIHNIGTSGTAITATGPTFGAVGFTGDLSSWPPAPGPSGVFGIGQNAGVAGSTNQGSGIWGTTKSGTGGEFTVFSTNSGNALYAHTAGQGHAGIFRKTASTGNTPTLLVENNSTSPVAFAVHSIITPTNPGSSSAALRAQNNGTGGFGIGLWASHSGSGWGIYSSSGAGGFAGFFAGDVNVIGTLSKSGGSFKIDHPQDPANMYLSHSFVESPDMKNIYDGVVVLNKQGQATITLPTYFNALNQDFRYQLTTIGAYAPVYIHSKIESSQNTRSFTIAGGTPHLEVSWMVTGVRQDAWANKNRIPTEEIKPDNERGKYLNPEAFGQPKELGIGYRKQPITNEHTKP